LKETTGRAGGGAGRARGGGAAGGKAAARGAPPPGAAAGGGGGGGGGPHGAGGGGGGDRAGGAGGGGVSPGDRMIERLAFALQYLRNHPLLRRLLRTEPEAILPSLTVNGGPVVDLAREHVAAFIRRDLFGSQQPSADAERHIATVAELGVRIVLSFILTPSTAIPMDTLDDARAFARDLIAPVHAGLLSERARTAAGS